MKKQKNKSNQLDINKNLIYDYDDKVTKFNEIFNIFLEELKENVEIINYKNMKIISYKEKNITNYFLTGSITWLNFPHPLFKKRLQLKKWYKDFYDEYSIKENVKIYLIGIYKYKDNIIFVDFKITDYISNKLNSSSAHVYINDLYQAMEKGIFQKKDYKENTITTIFKSNLKKYLNKEKIQENSIENIIIDFNKIFSFDKWITAKDAITEMKNDNWYQWQGTEWAGWFLEYKFEKFLKNIDNNIIKYIGNIKNEEFDFDLYFKEEKFYGDLKSSDISQKEILGNDKDNVENVINKYGKLWYIVYEHETIKDIEKNSEMAIERMKLIGKYTEGCKISYKERMKHSVNFRKMEIFEINKVNMNELLSDFNQGKQVNGSKRKSKIKFSKKIKEKLKEKRKEYRDNYIIFSYSGGKNVR